MNTGDIVEFIPEVFRRAGTHKWALRACEKGTLFRVIKREGNYVRVEMIDDLEVLAMLERDIGDNHLITLSQKNVRKLQNREKLRELLKDGKISHESYLVSLTMAVD